MSPISRIRKEVLHLTQAGLAEIAGVTQATVSRWETGEWSPRHADLARIRASLRARGIAWDDAWFFDPPNHGEGK